MMGFADVSAGSAALPTGLLLLLLSLYVVPRAIGDLVQARGLLRTGVYLVVLVLGLLALGLAVVPHTSPTGAPASVQEATLSVP